MAIRAALDIDSYDWFHMLKASVAIKSDLPQKANLAIEGLHILAMTLTDAVSPIGLLSIRCPTALFWRSLARTLSSQLHDCYN